MHNCLKKQCVHKAYISNYDTIRHSQFQPLPIQNSTVNKFEQNSCRQFHENAAKYDVFRNLFLAFCVCFWLITVRTSYSCFAHASTNARKSSSETLSEIPRISGCHCTPITKSFSGWYTASMMPSSAAAILRSGSASLLIA